MLLTDIILKIRSMIAKPDVFKKANKIIEQVVVILEAEIRELNKRSNAVQPKARIAKGEIFYKGLFLPLSSVEHRLLFENYEIVVLRNFLELYGGIYKNIENVFTQFAVRTLREIGHDHITILFNPQTEENDRKRFKLLNMLSDYAFMENDEEIMYLNHFKKLLEENKALLSENQLIVFKEISERIEGSDKNIRIGLIKNARKTILQEKNRILQRLGKNEDVNRIIHFDALNSSFSHLLHGNSFLINNLFSTRKNPYQHLFRMYSVMMVIGIDVANEVNKSLKISTIQEEIIKINSEFEITKLELLKTWDETNKSNSVVG